MCEFTPERLPDEAAEIDPAGVPHVVVHHKCDICGHKTVGVLPQSFDYDEHGCECSECGNMTVYPDESPDEED